jgi:hypothetical protein
MFESVPAEEFRIRTVLEHRPDAVRRHDLPAILACRDPDVRMFDLSPSLQCKGIEAYDQTWEGGEPVGPARPIIIPGTRLSFLIGRPMMACHERTILQCGLALSALARWGPQSRAV